MLTRDFATGVDLIARSLREPTFPPEEVERRRKEMLGELESDEDEPGVVAQRVFRAAVFGDAAYGHAVDGTPESVAALTRDDVLAFHRNEIRPERTICAIVGDVETAEMKSTAQRLLGDWHAAGEGYVAKAAQPPPAKSIVVDRPVTQANIVLGQIGVARSNPDYFPILLMNYVLGGGGFNSRLMETIRTKGGLAYSVSSHFEGNKLPGPFQVVLQTKVESAADAIRMVRAEVDEAARRGRHRGGAAGGQGLSDRQLPAAPRLDRQARGLPRPDRVLRSRRRLHRSLRGPRACGHARRRPRCGEEVSASGRARAGGGRAGGEARRAGHHVDARPQRQRRTAKGS